MSIAFLLGDLATLRRHLSRERLVYQPQADDAGVAHWSDMEGDAVLSGEIPQFSPKQFFFAERETLFRFNEGRFTETLPEPEPFALLGVRACDLVAIAYQDRFFRDDPYYQSRRAAALLVGIDCHAPCNKGFCPTVDAGPTVRDGTADLVLHPRHEGNGWILIAATTAGEQALKGLQLDPAPDDWRVRRTEFERETVQRFGHAPHILEGARRINAGEVSAETWEALGVQCVACTGCTSLCPTCSCFATLEKHAQDGEGFERERCWDSCLFEGFQKEASGHNPSVTPGQRVERYWYHKFSDDYLPEFGRYGCVGCGRCETACIGVIGVHTVMRRIADQ